MIGAEQVSFRKEIAHAIWLSIILHLALKLGCRQKCHRTIVDDETFSRGRVQKKKKNQRQRM